MNTIKPSLPPGLAQNQAVRDAVDAAQELVQTQKADATRALDAVDQPKSSAPGTAALQLHQALVKVRKRLGGAGVDAVLASLDSGVKAAAEKSLPLPVKLGETPRVAHQRLLPDLVAAFAKAEKMHGELVSVRYLTTSDWANDNNHGLNFEPQKYLDDALKDAALPEVPTGIRGLINGTTQRDDAVRGRKMAVKFAEQYNEDIRKVWPEAPPEILAATPNEPENHNKLAQRSFSYNSSQDTLKNLLESVFVAPVQKDVLALESAVLGAVFPAADEVATRRARLFNPDADPEKILPELAQEAEGLLTDLMVFVELTPDQQRMAVVARTETNHSSEGGAEHDSHETGFLRRPKDVQGGTTQSHAGRSVTSQSVLRTVKGEQTAVFRRPEDVSPQKGVHSQLDGAIFVSRLALFQQVLDAASFHSKDHPITKELNNRAGDVSFNVHTQTPGVTVKVPLNDVRQELLKLERSLPLPQRFIDQMEDELRSGAPRQESSFGREALADL